MHWALIRSLDYDPTSETLRIEGNLDPKSNELTFRSKKVINLTEGMHTRLIRSTKSLLGMIAK